MRRIGTIVIGAALLVGGAAALGACPSTLAAQEPARAQPASGHAAHTAHGNTARAPQAPDTVPLYDDLGDHAWRVTASPAAQAYFDQGLRLYYAFNHQESIRSFRAAQRLDPGCAMCWAGEALAWGPNINLPMDSAAGVAAHAAAERAVAELDEEGPIERAVVAAAAARYGADPMADRAARDSAYARALAVAVERFPGERELAVLRAESMMDLRPWDYWTDAGAPEPGTEELLGRLEGVMAANPNHPGACHFYIHAVEEVAPERAVACAERLAGLMPGAGHLVHMPGHIYIRVGRYVDAIRANEHAVHADETYIQDQRPGMGVYTAGYYPHNYDFLAFAALMAGRRAQAVGAAEKVASLIPAEMQAAPGFQMLQHYATRPLQLYVRFGMWDRVLAHPEPAAGLIHARAMWSYARGRALAATGDVAGAERQLAALRAAAEGPELADVRLEPNMAPQVLAIAVDVLAGRIAEARGDIDDAARALHEAVRHEAALKYGEPPEWTVPVRHELGEVLLAAGRVEEAERVYREALDRFPENGWSLHGLAAALRAQGRTAEAEAVAARFRDAWSGADAGLATSR